MKIIIATKNPAKIEGAKLAFMNFYNNIEIVSIPAPSNVPEQPVNLEIYQGAKNRVDNVIKYCEQNNIKADFYAAIESGISDALGKWSIINVAVIKDKNGYESWGNSAGFPVPQKYVQKIIDIGLGEVMDQIFKENDLRSKKGGINFITNGAITRADISKDAFIMALTQFVNNYWKN